MFLLKSGRLVLFLKVQAGLAFPGSFVKGALFYKFLFFGDSCLCLIQAVSGFVGFPDVFFKFRGVKFFLSKLQAGRFRLCGGFLLRPAYRFFRRFAGMGGFDMLHDALRFACVRFGGSSRRVGKRDCIRYRVKLCRRVLCCLLLRGFLKIRVLRPFADTLGGLLCFVYFYKPVAGHFLRDFITGL